MAGIKGRSGNRTGNSGHKRTDVQRELDRAEMMKMLARGATRRQVAEKLGVSVEQVGHDYRIVMRELAGEVAEDVQVIRQVKLEELAEMKREAWQAWEKSKEQKVRVTRSTFENERGIREQVTEQRDGSCGDPRFLAVLDRVITAERELLGLNPPKEVKAEVSGTVAHGIDWEAVADAASSRKALTEVEDRIRAALGPPQAGEVRVGKPALGEVIEALSQGAPVASHTAESDPNP